MSNTHITDFSGQTLKLLRNPTIHCVGCCRDINEYTCPPHSHNMAELMYIVSGYGATEVEGNVYTLSPGKLVIYNPAVEHHENFTSREMPYFYHIKFDDFIVSGMPANSLLPGDIPPVFPAGVHAKAFNNLLDSMFSEAQSTASGNQDLLDRMLQCVVLMTLLILSETSRVLAPDNSSSLLCQIQHYLVNHYEEHISMEDVAEKFFINRSYLSHLFQKSIACTPVSYLTRIRINEACRLLSKTLTPIQDIAQQVGYGNLSNFYDRFRKIKGITPAEYRRMHNLAKQTSLFLVQEPLM